MKLLLTVLAIICVSGAAFAATSPYVGQENRSIKALSPAEIQGYLNGEGIGYAKAGELNHYPGPRHVLDLAEKLRLSTDQRVATRKLFEGMHAAAVPLGQQIVAAEGRLNMQFMHAMIDRDKLVAETAAIAQLEGRLRAVHLSAHLAERAVLSAAQVAQYDKLRGYDRDSPGTTTTHDHHHMSM
jgi:hypothetical protein